MRFQTYFKRQKGSASSDPLLGSDAAPIVSDPKRAPVTNGFEHRAIDCERIAVGYWYEGGGGAVTLPVTLWVFDEESGKYYQASTGTLTNGQITYLRCPILAPPPQTQANLTKPNQGVSILIQIADNTGPTGIYHFGAGPDLAMF